MYWIITRYNFKKVNNKQDLLFEYVVNPKLKVHKSGNWVLLNELDGFEDIPNPQTLDQGTLENIQKKLTEREDEIIQHKKSSRANLSWFKSTYYQFFPQVRSSDETGIHAKLNYHVIVENQTRKLSYLFGLILLFSTLGFLALYYFSVYEDPVMTDMAIEGYTSLIFEIKEAGITEEPDLEKNTEFYWTVYYIRYLTLRILCASVLVAFLFFLFRVYMRIRDDRSITLQREEALSAIQYVARGEWAYTTNEDGSYRLNSKTGLPEILPNIKTGNFTTKELLEILPVRTLFSTPIISKNNKDNNAQEEMISKIMPLTTQLSLTSLQLANLAINIKKINDTPPNKDSTSNEEEDVA